MTNADPAHEYHGMMASTWDLFRGDTSAWPDRGFYLEAIRRFGEPALDVACGTGRLLVDYVSLGLDVDGVDVSPEMLNLCRDKAAQAGVPVHVFDQAIGSLDLPRRYRCVVVPSSSFQLLLEPSEADAAMERLREHLEPGGALVMPFMRLWRPGDPFEEEWTSEAIRPDDGALIRRTSRSRFDPETSLEDTDDLYEVIVDGRIVASERHVRSPATRSYTHEEVRQLYERHGFERLELFGEFVWDRAGADDRIVCAVGFRP